MSLLLCCIVMALHLATGLDAAPGVVNTTEEEVEGGDSQSPCPAGWHQNEHRCFSFYPVWATWATAELYCSQHRGNLVSVHSPGQQVFVQDLVRRHTDQPVWMGGYDAAQEGMWLWSDGSAVDSFYWEEDEPSNSGQGENCMELHTGGGQGWNDVSCGELRFYVCSMETRSGLAVIPSQKKKHERGEYL
ncbi:ladderlectin-like isoform X2 [Oncorhynchus tshawytscha]|uniref:C-type lectin domain-containing protein n=2 Tax=Oncorhynchus tshawytscha TaxID=74940 RepID=A0A8C8LXH2_ONCTS|nr:ladderlectin-like isoform X2 [Oncorhynchus tshawytscha]XP_042171758.1 ladderlectin-like isoform X2 [Oncorhynchus tshawytscha]XP_042171759.1 ladderlectin-like isoform X2 [Oncorhynchus tshawytscha]XP_042171760.1 ladderlectin-like isoform X2 [Oncorhynchus tshawytscha]